MPGSGSRWRSQFKWGAAVPASFFVVVILVGALAPGYAAAASPPATTPSAPIANSVPPGVANGKLTPLPTSSAGNQPLTLTVTLKRSAPAAFDEFVSNVQNPKSSAYRHFLTQAQLSDRFGPSRSSYYSVSRWFESEGFHLLQGSTNRLTLSFKGTRALVDRALDASIREYEVGGRTLYSNTRDPRLPAPIASEVDNISGLSNLAEPSSSSPAPQSGSAPRSNSITLHCENGRCSIKVVNKVTGVAYFTPDFQLSVKSCGDLVKDILKGAAVVGVTGIAAGVLIGPEALAAGLLFCIISASGTLNNISGNWTVGNNGLVQAPHVASPPTQKIGLLEFDTFHQSDVADWLSLLGIAPTELSRVSEVPVNGGVSSPGAGEGEVLLDIDTVLLMTLQTRPDVVVYDASPTTSFQQVFNAMINDGDTVISNSWAQCEDQTSKSDAQAIDSILAQAAASGISVFNGAGDTGSTCLDGSPNTVAVPADSPNATAVGGSTYVPGPGGTYGGEGWWDGSNDTPPTGQGGFGVSQLFSRPAYQNGQTTAAGRSVPDVVAPADPAEGIQICEADAGGCPDGLSYGGTSFATPEWASVAADLNAQLATNIGNFNAAIYPLAGTAAFHSAADMGESFANVGLGDVDYLQLLGELRHYQPGSVSASVSTVLSAGTTGPLDSQVPADGTTQGTLRVDLMDSKGFPISGKQVSLAVTGCSDVTVSQPSGVSDGTGAVTFTATDTAPETCAFTATDVTDNVVISQQAEIDFVPPIATGAEIFGGPSTVSNDGTSQATITVYLENGLGQPATGKTVQLSEGGGGAVITPSGSTTPASTAVTDGAGDAVFTATDTNAETVPFTAVDVTDGGLPVPGSVVVNFAPITATCPTSLPVASSGYSVSSFATGFTYNTQSIVYPGNFTVGACTEQETAPAFDKAGNAYVSDSADGTIHVLPTTGGSPSTSNQLPDASFPPGTLGQLVFGKDGSLYAGLTQSSGSVSNPEIVQIDPNTGATLGIVADAASGLPDCPFVMAVDPLSGDLFTDDECSGYAASSQISRISNPDGADPTVSDYLNTGNCNLGLAFAPNGTLYVANCSSGELDQIGGTNTVGPTETKVASISGTPFAVAVTGANAAGKATSIDVFTFSGDVVAVDLTPSPATTTTIATGSSFFYLSAVGLNGCGFGTLPGTIVELCPTSGPTASQTLTLSTSAPANPPTGTPETFTATLSGVPNPTGTPILFKVTGANGQANLVHADASGSASFQFSGIYTGTDTVQASTTVGASYLTSNPIAITWAAGLDTSFLTLNGSQQTGAIGQPATISANLSDISLSTPAGIGGATVSVMAGGQPCTITTDSSGSGSCQITPSTTGDLTVSASYAGNSSYTASSATSNLFVGGPQAAVAAGTYTAVAPTRICDTRAGNPSLLTGAAAQCNGSGDAGETLASLRSLAVDVAGSFGVPADATTAVLNVTVTRTRAPGYLTAYPTGGAPPTASNLNFTAGQVVPNLTEVAIGTNGQISFVSNAATDLVVDLEGFIAPQDQGGAGLYDPLATPARICDTRAGNPSDLTGGAAQCNGVGNAGASLLPGTPRDVQVEGVGGVPASDVSAAVLNVTVTRPAADGYLTVYPEGITNPDASNVNYLAGQTVPNRVIVPVSSTGQIALFSTSGTDVVVDVSGWYSATGGSGTLFTPLPVPTRICDTRPGNPSDLVGLNAQCNGHGNGGKPINQGTTLSIGVAGRAGVPADAVSVVVNVTAIRPTAKTYLTIFPGSSPPLVSDLNPSQGQTEPNLVVATLSSTGTINIYNRLGSVNVVVDVVGWYT